MKHAKLEPRRIAILGTGHALPQRAVSSEELDGRLRHKKGTVLGASGVRQRYVASRSETATALGARAARHALDAAGIGVADVDCVVAASGSLDQGMPNNAALLHRELGLSSYGTPSMDVNASCLSFLAAIDLLSWPIAAGRYRRVLLVASDISSCALNWDTLEASAIFGDGAAAAVIGPAETGGARILASALTTLSQGADFCQIRAGGTRYHPTRTAQAFGPLALFRMNGKGVFKLASAYLPGFLDKLLASASLTRDQLDWIVPHQASHLALAHLTKRLGFARDRVIDIFAEHGNQVAASLPTALDMAVRDGRIRRGHRILLLGTGAGLSLGGMVLEY